MMKWLDTVKAIAPILISVINPALAPVASVIAAAIGEAEQIPGATGADKKSHVLAIVTDAATAINAAAKKVVLDPASMGAAAGAAIDTVISIVNLIHKA